MWVPNQSSWRTYTWQIPIYVTDQERFKPTLKSTKVYHPKAQAGLKGSFMKLFYQGVYFRQWFYEVRLLSQFEALKLRFERFKIRWIASLLCLQCCKSVCSEFWNLLWRQHTHFRNSTHFFKEIQIFSFIFAHCYFWQDFNRIRN